ncbi:spermidine synthase [Candidatus Bathyarchaeota archaeon]|nr:spermidine synthase [Candidatus Bathyarchaeota archaeon]
MAATKNFKIWGVRFNVFISGAVVMALELVASRLLAPTFGDSIFVWGNLIGVVMIGLSIGYYFGGKIADRMPSYRTFSMIILVAGIFILLIPASYSFIIELILWSGLGDRYGPLIACLLILGAPTVLLGMVSPYSIKLSADDFVRVGGISGGLYSISTAGSILGTFFTVFVLIPTFGVRTILISLGLILVIVSMLGLFWVERILSLLLILLLIVPPNFLSNPGSSGILYSKETPYSTLTIIDSSDIRTLYLNNLAHSAMYLNGSTNSVYKYTDYFNLGFAFNPRIRNVLFIGGGGFSGPKQFLEYYPTVNVDVVEIDPDVVSAAVEFFGVISSSRLRIYVEDGRTVLNKLGSYDLIVLDAYSKSYVPFHLMTYEFFNELSNHLSSDGLILSNLISSYIGDTSNLMRAEYKTVNLIFPQVYIFYTSSPYKAQLQNLILVATKNIFRYNTDILSQNALTASKNGMLISQYAKTLFDSIINTSDVPILTDDFAPTENLLNPITLAPYEFGGERLPKSVFNPFLIAGVWLVAFTSIYFIYSSIWKEHVLKQKNVQV